MNVVAAGIAAAALLNASEAFALPDLRPPPGGNSGYGHNNPVEKETGTIKTSSSGRLAANEKRMKVCQFDGTCINK